MCSLCMTWKGLGRNLGFLAVASVTLVGDVGTETARLCITSGGLGVANAGVVGFSARGGILEG